MLIVHLHLRNGLVLCAENIPKIIVLNCLTWQYCLPFSVKRNLLCQLDGVSEPGCYEQMDVNLNGLIKHHIFTVSASSNYKTVFLPFIFWVVVKQNGRRINFSFPKIGFLDENECLFLDFIDHAFEEIFFLLLLIPKNNHVIFSFILNVFHFNDDEFFLQRNWVKIFKMNFFIINLVKGEKLSLDSHKKLLAVSWILVFRVKCDDKSWRV